MAEQAASASGPTQPAPNAPGITPELVQEIADKVYALLLADLRIERERLRLTRHTWHGQGGRR